MVGRHPLEVNILGSNPSSAALRQTQCFSTKVVEVITGMRSLP
ncbi:MAG: hypothetical protein UV56_C0016G0009 [Candidatus Woesebacteria bacterium GW2011_GWC1_43_10b]|uniref:Uncharacterized protein n=2 Tax=Candidatus Woeseibacteriota TaxID=1752722 RepID=A0A0G1C4X2_9BACT|nr:MAG: hypothetical protein UT24_C0007G0029 [Candidatus Woesebacteria bacterium GW2011_GWB1_39_12]KKS80494.1 MAG: hypothetical protein UV56_C0016G0009 [Candidatus Woesebacteria bacterium GW2011_GWC1_43_10b]